MTWFWSKPPPLSAGSGPCAVAAPAVRTEPSRTATAAIARSRGRLIVVIAEPHRAGRWCRLGRGGAAGDLRWDRREDGHQERAGPNRRADRWPRRRGSRTAGGEGRRGWFRAPAVHPRRRRRSEDCGLI